VGRREAYSGVRSSQSARGPSFILRNRSRTDTAGEQTREGRNVYRQRHSGSRPFPRSRSRARGIYSTIIHSIQEGRDRPRLEVDHGDDLAVLHRGEAHAREDAAGVVRVERRLPSSLSLQPQHRWRKMDAGSGITGNSSSDAHRTAPHAVSYR
jgi:hypothetical protein